MKDLKEVKPLYDIGFSLIYLYPKAKNPIEDKWTILPNKTWRELQDDFSPKYNIGVRLGEHSYIKGKGYLVCIDVDIKNPDFKLDALEKLNEITKGKKYCEVRSGSGNGSRHLYCVSKKPFKMITIAKEEGWEICAYSTGRQTVLPPSIHPSGKSYEWYKFTGFKYLPLFNPDDFKSVGKTNKHDERDTSDFKAVDVNLYKTNLPTWAIKAIIDGEGVDDRSASLFSVTLAMCKAGMSDNQILSVLTDTENWMSECAYDHTQSRSRSRAIKWINKYSLSKARYETDIMRRFENKPKRKKLSTSEAEEVADDVKEAIEWKFPDLTKERTPKNTQRNVVYALEKRLDVKCGLNQFSNRPIWLANTLYGSVKGNEVGDNDDLRLKEYLSKHFRFEPSKETCWEAHTLLSLRNAFHPVREYLDSLEWDGEARLDDWLKTAFRAIGPDEYLSAVGRKTLVAAVARVYEPGIKFDHMLILEGEQGRGKSTALRLLAGNNWFTDGLGDIHNKDVVDQMSGKWLIEMSELVAFKKSDKEMMKSFISRQTDRVRMPYGRRSADFPRQCIFIGTTNDEEYLTDETGNRRYWPVSVGKADFKWFKNNRDQIWAEAKVRYDLGEKLYLDDELELTAREQQAKRQITDEWQSKVKTIINNPKKYGRKFTATSIFQAMEGNVGQEPTQWEAMRIGKIMRKLGYKRKTIRISGDFAKGWLI